MKKTLLLGLCLMGGLFASAQNAGELTQKDGELIFKEAQADIKTYDDLLGKKQLGMLKDGEGLTMAQKLVSAYDKYMKALPLDQLPDPKNGKVKPKYTGKIWSQLQGHVYDFNSSALDFWNAKDFDGAYNSWQIFFDLVENPEVGPKIKMPNDTVLSEVAYNQGIAAWQADNLPNAVKAFRKAVNLGYDKKAVFEYGMAVAANAKDNDALLEFAEKGNHLFGGEDPQFINQIINYYLNTEKYDEALDFLGNAIAENPNQAQYYALKGIILDNKGDRPAAMVEYEKALTIDPENGLGNFYMGRALAAKAGDMSDNYDGADYAKYKETEIIPVYKKSAEYLEKAYEVDENNRGQALQLLDVVYYNIGDAAGVESVASRKLAD